ncbi:hypothetical protein OB236_14415 [Paenibacillus sp. WQ 127069]|uniref:Apea-like HEPN domain-containing protein n=1 Tax=Paenibacillus baimaensis TaxID=2982185 RepID=A0ABT2UF87_9BACL|nr:hypothetical protein [Paenibacillus sp. WQ 127069]MCU6793307.1 hypothetical protein [Paenibacillus sp. WQ 127069]
MKVSDFLGINWDKPYKVDFVEYCEYLITSGFIEIEREICELLKIKKLPMLSNDQIVEGAIFKSRGDKSKKEGSPNYFKCNAVCMLSALKKIVNEDIVKKLKVTNNDLLIYNYSSLVEDMLLDYQDLVNLIKGERITRSQFTMAMYQTYRQLVYGQCSYHSFSEKEVNMSITLIRQAIEVRIRRSIGVLGVENKDGGIEPIALSTILEILGRYKESITFAVPLEKLSRIYSWANIFVHTGEITYRWLPVMLEGYLKPFLIGQMRDGGRSYDVDNGIEMSEETLSKIKTDLFKELKSGSKLFECSPEAIIH